MAICPMNKHKVFALPVRVYFQDTDAGGVVYHASYVNFMERARTEWLRTHGYSNAGLMKEFGVVFVVRSLKLDYFKPALLDDLLRQNVKRLNLGLLRPDATVLTGLAEVSRKRGAAVTVTQEDVSFEMDLPATFDDYLRTLNTKQRHEVRRKLRRLCYLYGANTWR